MSENGTNDSEASKRAAPLKPPHRRLVVMFDGTGNTRQSLTNVSRMFEAIDDSHPESYKCIGGSEAKSSSLFRGPACTKIVPCETCNESRLERAEHAGDDSEANFRAGVPCGSCHQRVMEPVVEPALQPVQLVKYITGVGTSWWGIVGRLTAQAVGYGLSGKVQEGYAWLCSHYKEGDEVFVFGFSRGAFAARSLVSLVCKCGLLQKRSKSRTPDDRPMTFGDSSDSTVDDMKAIETAYNYYRAYVESPDAAKLSEVELLKAELKRAKVKGAKLKEVKLKEEAMRKEQAKQIKRKLILEEQKEHLNTYLKDWNNSTVHEYTIDNIFGVPVKMLGVWDTVGALGVPETGNSLFDKFSWSRAQYQFHNESLSSIVENAYHALALDEHREAFKPTLWTSQGPQNQEVKQVWFVGSHCNVGGGADLDDNDDPDDLWQYSYVWMQRHAEKHGLRFFWSLEYPATRQVNSHSRTRRVSLREPEPSLENFVLGLYNKYKQLTPWWSITPYIRETDPKLAMLHWSVIQRIKVTEDDRKEAEKINLVKKAYRPASLFMREHTYDEFKASVIPECVTAPDQVDAEGTPEVTPWRWHIETDDVNPCTQWGLPRSVPVPVEEKKEEGTPKVIPHLSWWQKFEEYLSSGVYKLLPSSHENGVT